MITPRLACGALMVVAMACASAQTIQRRALAEADALYATAMHHARPDRETYDPRRAAALLLQFTELFPADARRAAAAERLALLREIVALQDEIAALRAIDLGRSPPD